MSEAEERLSERTFYYERIGTFPFRMNGRIGFDSEKYSRLQADEIRSRLSEFGGKLYMEIGGKIFDDYHAARVLPGFKPDSKIRMLSSMKDDLEAVVVVSCNDVEKSKVREDIGITYDLEAMRMIDLYRSYGIKADTVVLTMYTGQPAAESFRRRLEEDGVSVSLHRPIPGYPTDTALIVSDEGYGLNDYVKTEKPVVMVTGPGPGSGKMAVCLSQVYQDGRGGMRSGYAKFETFPVWNLPLNHPVNLAYEAATADLGDKNMIDPYHMEAYGVSAINYNRDIETFPVLKAILDGLFGDSPYKSPTDMGINTVGRCIRDEEAVGEASKREIVRRYFGISRDRMDGRVDVEAVKKVELLMKQASTSPDDFELYRKVRALATKSKGPVAGAELPSGKIVTGKATDDLSAVSACLINAAKDMAGVSKSVKPIQSVMVDSIQMMKRDLIGNADTKLRADEMLVALAFSARLDEDSKRTYDMIAELRGCDLHGSVVLYPQDISMLRKLGLNVTSESVHQTSTLFQS